jgi:UDP-N-acetylmuramate--alanine ligase
VSSDLSPPQPDLTGGPRHFHLIGVGGAGMNGMATMLVAMGHRVSGSDVKGSAVLERLGALGVQTSVGHDPANVGDADFVVSSTAIKASNPEVVEAGRRGIPVLSRADLLAAICARCRTLAVSGTHGKTTTTAMLAAVLNEAGFNPSYLVGGELPGGRGGAFWSGGPWLVVEADEADGTFVRLGAQGVIVTNVEPDHLDYFGDEKALASAFERFVAQAPGPRIVCGDDKTASSLASGDRGVITYGTSEGSDYQISTVDLAAGGSTFEVHARGASLGRFELIVPGLHNVRNATAALAMAAEVGASPTAARAALAHYAGVGRRFEWRGTKDGVTYIDDYAHNPGKVRATLAAAQHGQWGRIVAVFEPHRYSRTAALWQDFADAFDGADAVVVTGLYAAGEEPLPGISGRLVANAVSTSHPALPVEYAESRTDLVAVLQGMLRPGDLCLTMGAGDVTTLPGDLLGGAGRGPRPNGAGGPRAQDREGQDREAQDRDEGGR